MSTVPGDSLTVRLDLALPGFRLDVDLLLPGAGVTALFGPSGSGKTTCLRAIAGLEAGAAGQVRLGDRLWQDSARGFFVPVHRRPLGYVFQDAALFPHLSVRGNLDYGARRVRGDGPALAFDAIVALLGLGPLLARRPSHLSGGERQRVGIARALLARPRLLLLDEPLASLDDARKREILPYLERLRDELAIPALYVSHSIDEVARLADHLVLLEHGAVVASGPLRATLARTDLPPAFLEHAGVVVEGRVVRQLQDDLLLLDIAGGQLLVPASGQAVGQVMRCRIAAGDVSLAMAPARDTSIGNQLPVTVLQVVDASHPAMCLVQLDAGGTRLLAQVTRRAWKRLGLAPGASAWAQIKAVAGLG